MKKIISALIILTMIVSMVCVSATAAGVHINMNFDNMDAFTQQFRAGAFFIEDGVLYGYSEARALQSDYLDGEDGIFRPHPTSWLTYDCSITLTVADDEVHDGDRFVNIVYCNDNLRYMGHTDERVYMAFCYDIQNRCFRLSEGFSVVDEDKQYVTPIPMEIPTDGEKEITMGMSVGKDNIRCFYEGQLIFDYTNPDMLIAKEIVSPFVFFQDGNFIQITNITIADQGYLYPAGGPAPVETTTKETTTRVEQVTVTNEKGEAVTDEKGEVVTDTVIITEAPADTNTGAVVGGNATATGDVTFIVVAAMVATLGCALIVRKVSAE